MKLTRVIAVSVIAAAMSALTAQAQTLRDATPPAEFPPASFKGKQYVDSRGCIYIRAGIDGNVTWVPRVTRGRKQVCGYKPTLVPGTTVAKAPPKGPAPVLITVPPEGRPGAEQAASEQAAPMSPAAKPKPKPLPQAVVRQEAKPKPSVPAVAAPVPAPKPAASTPPAQTAQRRPSPGPEPTVFSSAPRPKAVAPAAQPRPAAPVRTTQRRPSPGPEPTVFSSTPQRQPATPVIAPRKAPAQAAGNCPNASPFSRQYINTGPGVRCGPQAEPPVTYRSGGDQKSSLPPAGKQTQVVTLSPDTRVVPRHVYEQRRNTNSFTVPKGYRPVWSDDRLNPHRAEHSLRPADRRPVNGPPPGYVGVARDDDRLNPNRGIRSARGDAQTDMIWTRTVPRRLVRMPADRPVLKLSKDAAPFPAEARRGVVRLSTRSAPAAAAPVVRR